MINVKEFVINYEALQLKKRQENQLKQERVLSGVRDENTARKFNEGLTDKEYDEVIGYMIDHQCNMETAKAHVLGNRRLEREAEMDFRALRKHTGFGGEGPAPKLKLNKSEARRVRECTKKRSRKKHKPTVLEMATDPLWIISELAFETAKDPDDLIERIFMVGGDCEIQRQVKQRT